MEQVGIPLRKAGAGGAAGFYWPHDGSVVVVPAELAQELLGIRGGGFSEPLEGELQQTEAVAPPGEDPNESTEGAKPAKSKKVKVVETE